PLLELLRSVGEAPLPRLNFLVGDRRLYGREERKGLIKLPAVIFDNLAPETATELAERLERHGIGVRTPETPVDTLKPQMGVAALFLAALSGWVALISAALLVSPLLSISTFVFAGLRIPTSHVGQMPLLRLRQAPAMLPAADPLVARLAALLSGDAVRADVRAQVTELAVLVQRLADHRAEALGARAEIDLVTEPVAPLVGLIEKTVAALGAIDAELA